MIIKNQENQPFTDFAFTKRVITVMAVMFGVM